MKNEDKITLTREQWDAFYREGNCTEQCYPSFDSLKAHVEKPKRRQLWIDLNKQEVIGEWNPLSMPTGASVELFTQVMTGDIGPMTREEARKWLITGFDRAYNQHSYIDQLFKALGLVE